MLADVPRASLTTWMLVVLYTVFSRQTRILNCPLKIPISGCPWDTSDSTCPKQNSPCPLSKGSMQHFTFRSSKGHSDHTYPHQKPKPEPLSTLPSSSLPSPHSTVLCAVDSQQLLFLLCPFPTMSWCQSVHLGVASSSACQGLGGSTLMCQKGRGSW